MTAAPAAAEALCRRREDCRLCQGTDVTQVLSLAPTPPANAFVDTSALGAAQAVFPLDVWFCRGCTHVQLLDVVDPALLFRDYVYVSGTSPVFVSHFETYARLLIERFAPAAGDLVVDIGSNDGTLLRFFQRNGQRALGVDPAVEIARRASEQGIETIPAFFTPELSGDIRARYGPARVVTANNVFAHIDDLASVVDGVRSLLAPDGVLVFEVSYLLDVVQKTLFDTIYHEHLDYHSVRPLQSFFPGHGMELVDAERVDTHGGSLRVTVQHAGGPYEVGTGVADLLADEDAAGLHRPETFEALGARIEALGAELRALLQELRADGKRVAGFGAPAKATTLMHHFGLGPQVLDFIVDDSPLKQGLYTPGHHVPVLPAAAIDERRPDYLLILAWNFAEPIMRAQKAFADGGGRFIVPLPTLRIV